MKSKRVAWLNEDEKENISKYDLSFDLAKQVILNELSLALDNVHGDYSYIGLTDDMLEVVYVYCIFEDGITRIVLARRATSIEKNSFFDVISGASNEKN